MLRSSLLDTAMQHKYGGSAWYILVNSFDMSSGILQFLEVLWIKFTALIVVPPALSPSSMLPVQTVRSCL